MAFWYFGAVEAPERIRPAWIRDARKLSSEASSEASAARGPLHRVAARWAAASVERGACGRPSPRLPSDRRVLRC